MSKSFPDQICPVPFSDHVTECFPAVEKLWEVFAELIVTPFRHEDLIWGVVPLYFSWLVAELTSSKASPKTALQTGFTLLWAGANWTWQYLRERPDSIPKLDLGALLIVKVAVTLAVLVIGAIAFVSGLRRKFPKGFRFLGHARFAGYFLIAIFPMQSAFLPWTWMRFLAVIAFAVPVWLVMHFGLMPVRR
jgi:hypothetical protein